MHDRSKVSIIIPAFNRSVLLRETLQSVAAQSYPHWECIVVDDRSTEDTQSVVESFSRGDGRFQFTRRPADEPKGSNTCRAVGLRLATGSFVKWLDSDDLLEADALGRQVRTLEHGFDGVFNNAVVMDHSMKQTLKKNWRPYFFEKDNPIQLYLKGQLGWPNGAGMFVKERILTRSPFSEPIGNSQEWLFHLKLITTDLRIAFDAACGLRVRASDESIGRKKNPRYFLDRCKARIIAMEILIRTRNHGKRHLMKVIARHLIDFIRRGDVKFFILATGFLFGYLPRYMYAFAARHQSVFHPEMIN